jgi:hypothetical protein
MDAGQVYSSSSVSDVVEVVAVRVRLGSSAGQVELVSKGALERLRVGNGQPPVGNTGGKVANPEKQSREGVAGENSLLSINLDGFNCSLPKAMRGKVELVLAELLGPVERGGARLPHYDEVEHWLDGARLGWSAVREDACLVVNGRTAAKLGFRGVWLLIKYLRHECWAKGTRLDVNADDYGREVFDLARVHEAGRSGAVCGFRIYRPVQEWNVQSGELLGDTAYFGRRGSDGSGRYVRFYDKKLESGGEQDCVRFELEMSQEWAETAFRLIADMQHEEEVLAACGEFLGGAIEFREASADRQVDRHKERRGVVAWWARCRELLGAAVVRVGRAKSVLQGRAEYVLKTFGRTLAELAVDAERQGLEALDFVRDVIVKGRADALAHRRGARDEVDFGELLFNIGVLEG